jgi:hypothetical protein
MQTKLDKTDILTTIVVYHEEAEQLGRKLGDIAAFLSNCNLASASEQFKELYQHDFVDHFKFEEHVIFPAVHAWDQGGKYAKLLHTYTSVHSELLAQGEKALAFLGVPEASLTRELVMKAAEAFSKLSDRLCRHACDENEHIVPVIQNNPTLRFLTARKMVEAKTAFIPRPSIAGKE